MPSPYTAHSLDYSPLWRQRLAIHFPIVLILMVVTAHAYQIETMTQLFFATHSPYIGIILKHNLPVIGLFILIHHISWQLNNKVIKILMSATWLALLLFMISDLVVFKLFYKRLDFQEVALFGKEWRAVIRMAFQVASNPENIYITIPFISTLITPFIIYSTKINPECNKSWRLTIPIAAILISTTLINDQHYYAPDVMVANIIENQYENLPPPSYSHDYLTTINKTALEKETCIAGQNKKSNIILVALESLSLYQSHWYSGINNWLPGIDALAQRYPASRLFYANGYRTDLGLYAILTGLEPLPPDEPGKHVFTDQSKATTITQALRPLGYKTAFFSAGDLDFLNTRKWINSLDFDDVHGPEHPDFRGLKRTALGAIKDDVLYEQATRWLSRQKPPAFVMVSTLGSHVPYSNPDTGVRGEEAAFRYADHAFSEFIRKLEESGYFKSGGVVLLTGDHRAIGPIYPAETLKYGNSAPARIPLLLIGDALPVGNDFARHSFQQTDIVPSLAYLAGPKACFSARQRNLFGEQPRGDRCIFQARGDKLKHVGVYCQGGANIVELNGDDTFFVGTRPSNAQTILDEIAFVRTQGSRK